jgi:PAS domain S-box-containing protein
MMDAIEALNLVVRREREEDDRRTRELSRAETRKVTTGTVAVLVLGFLVAALTFYEIRKVLKRLEKAYGQSQESRDYLQSLLDSLVSGVVVIEQEGRVKTISDSFKRLHGINDDELLEKDYKELFKEHPSLIGWISEQLRESTTETRYVGRVELEGMRVFEVFASPLIIAEEHRGLILVFVDITETTRAQSELRRNRALAAIGQMTAQIAHEIKNPLGSIRFATEVLKRQNPNVDSSELETISVIDRSVDHLASIVAELSEFARPKELNRSSVNLNELLEGLTPMVADRLSAKGVSLKEDFAATLEPGQYDVTELRKLFLNLIINAIDASSPGGEIDLRTKVNGNRDVMIEIEDHGSGMDEETLRRLYEPFYTTKDIGTGLGMAIAKKIAELHRGDLFVKSRLGQGTTVIVRLPLS